MVLRLTAVATLLFTVAAHAAKPKATAALGTVCIAPFHTPAPISEPSLSENTWPPTAGSVFHFQIGKSAAADVRAEQTVTLHDLPADRRLLVRVTLDGRPFESFRIDLAREPKHRACYWLYPGYWHWINVGWEQKLGCSCK